MHFVELFYELQSFLEVGSFDGFDFWLVVFLLVGDDFAIAFGMLILEGRVLRDATSVAEAIVPLPFLDFMIDGVVLDNAGEHPINLNIVYYSYIN